MEKAILRRLFSVGRHTDRFTRSPKAGSSPDDEQKQAGSATTRQTNRRHADQPVAMGFPARREGCDVTSASRHIRVLTVSHVIYWLAKRRACQRPAWLYISSVPVSSGEGREEEGAGREAWRLRQLERNIGPENAGSVFKAYDLRAVSWGRKGGRIDLPIGWHKKAGHYRIINKSSYVACQWV